MGAAPGPEDDPRPRLRPGQYVRKAFTLRGPVARAQIRLTAHGLCRLWINGKRPDERVLCPEVTAFDKQLTYALLDVAALLHPGPNALGVILTDGWHVGRIGLTGESCQYADRLALLLQLDVVYTDGGHETIDSDGTFRASTGALDYSDLYIGERYDARKAPLGWTLPDFDDSSWSPVRETTSGEALTPQTLPPVLKHERLEGRLLVTPKGEQVYDFGQVIAGVERVTLRGARGCEVLLEHSETLDADGNFMHNIVGRNKQQTDCYVCAGQGEERYEPIGTFHGFRYLKVSGAAQVIRAEAFAIRTDNRETADFTSSDERLNQLWRNIRWSLRGNTISIPTDCPQRERAGFTGDMQIFAPTALWLMDLRGFLSSWLATVRLEQTEAGEVPVIAPNFPAIERMQRGMGQTNCAAGWGDAILLVPWAMYGFYGDVAILRENYDAMRRWLHFVAQWARTGQPYPPPGTPSRRGAAQYLWDTGFSFGDWLVPSRSQGLESPFATAEATKGPIGTCYFAQSAHLLSRIAAILGEEADAARYAELAARIREAYTQTYYEAKGRLRGLQLQGLYVTALAFDMLPEAERPATVQTLAGLIAQNGDRLDTGFLSVSHLLDALYNHGQQALAFRLLFQTQCPGWLYEVSQGATTLWETWNAVLPDGTVQASSMNHFAFGCVGDWMMRRLAGLQPTAPGFASVRIQPDFSCGLSRVKAHYDSIHGRIAVSWSRQDDEASLAVDLPQGVSAVLCIQGRERPLPPGHTQVQERLDGLPWKR